MVQLKLAINRLKLLQQKKTAYNQQARREIAQLLEKGKEDSARVRVEHIIREDFTIEAMEILELYSEMLLARFGLLEQMRHCDQAIAEAVNTIIYAAPRCEVKELSQVRDQLIAKFGKDFGAAAMDNENDVVNSRVGTKQVVFDLASNIVHKLRIQTPDPILVDQYLKAIAKAMNVAWEGAAVDNESLLDTIPNPSVPIPEVGFNYPQQYPNGVNLDLPTNFAAAPATLPNVPMTGFTTPSSMSLSTGVGADSSSVLSGMGGKGGYPVGVSVTPPVGGVPVFPVTPGDAGSGAGASGGAGDGDGVGGGGSDEVNFDELTRRFEALKRRK
ncbi:hypothetical protein HDU76_002238 [Blyttiomyces sp. JEL0837]|nr:hypothetical protein HDU76_002238 [Blyttiomyces sp. JEL0837]